MKYRLATILAEKSLGAPGTETIDINVIDPISRLEIGWRPTLADTSMAAALAAGISKIELIDGSDVLHSLNGRENQALCIYDRRVPTMNHANLINGSIAYATLGIDFGRYLYDPQLAFDPKKFKNPQLKITHDRTAIGASTSTHLLEIMAHCFDEKAITPVGFLSAKEFYSYTPTANDAYQYIDLPTDRPIRQLLLRNYKSGQDPQNVADYFRLDEDNEKRIPIDVEIKAYFRRMIGVWQLLQEGMIEYSDPQGNYDKYVTPTDDLTCVFQTPTASDAINCGGTDGYIHGGYVKRCCATGTVMMLGFAMGYLPHHCIQFPFGQQNDMDDWYDVTRLGSLRARIQAAAQYADSVISIITQQLRKY